MAKFLNTSATSYHLEELIKNARTRLVLISPYLQLNDKIRELLMDADRMKTDVSIVYGKNELHPDEASWLKGLLRVRTSFCKNLHAKCYLNENQCIITSMNLYEFSQQNNNEMGVLFDRNADPELFAAAADEAQRIIRISEEVRISMDRVPPSGDSPVPAEVAASDDGSTDGKYSSSKVARKLGLKTSELLDRLVAMGYLTFQENKHQLTDAGKAVGGVFRFSPKYGPYFLWPDDMKLEP